ncbi:g5622 [Coccomyxa elongata]
MDTSSSGSRKRKAYTCAEMESVTMSTTVGSTMGAVRGQFRAMSASASHHCETPGPTSSGACCELSAEPPSCVCFGTRLFTFSEDSLVRSMAAMYGFSSQCTSVGTSYFARLAARDERLMATSKAHPDFAPLVEGVCIDPEPLARPLAQELRSLTNPKQWLMALHLCCNYLAAKNIDKVMFRNLLTLILSHAHGEALPTSVALSLEIELLEALRWRLGPFFHALPSCCEPFSPAASKARQGCQEHEALGFIMAPLRMANSAAERPSSRAAARDSWLPMQLLNVQGYDIIDHTPRLRINFMRGGDGRNWRLAEPRRIRIVPGLRGMTGPQDDMAYN